MSCCSAFILMNLIRQAVSKLNGLTWQTEGTGQRVSAEIIVFPKRDRGGGQGEYGPVFNIWHIRDWNSLA